MGRSTDRLGVGEKSVNGKTDEMVAFQRETTARRGEDGADWSTSIDGRRGPGL